MAPQRATELVEQLGAHPLFASLDANGLDAVVAQAREINLDAGEFLYKSGEVADGVFVLLTGAIQIEYPGPDGERGPVATIIESPGFLGECQAIHTMPWSGTGRACTPLLVLSIKTQRLLELVRSVPELSVNLYLELTSRFLSAIQTWRFSPDHTPELKVARYLVGLHDVSSRLEPARRDAPPLHLRQVDVGLATGIRRETVNRLLKQWVESKWIRIEPKQLFILNVEALASIVAETPASPIVQRCTLPDLDGFSA